MAICIGAVAGNLAIGMSYGWWTDKHTRHHANPNHDDLDPDVAPDILIWSREATEGRRGLKRFVNAYQGYLFFPLLTLLAVSLCRSSIASPPSTRTRETMTSVQNKTTYTHIRALTAIAECGSFEAAARRLDISQSARHRSALP